MLELEASQPSGVCGSLRTSAMQVCSTYLDISP